MTIKQEIEKINKQTEELHEIYLLIEKGEWEDEEDIEEEEEKQEENK